MTSNIRRRHHTVPRFHLRKFASEQFLGLGLASAPSIAVPLDRRTLLWLDLPPHLRSTTASAATYGDRRRDAELLPTKALAVAHNTSAVLGAERFIFFHPDDDPVPPDCQVPRSSQPSSVEVTAPDMINRDRPLEDVLAQIANHHDPTGTSMIADYTWPIPGYTAPALPEPGCADHDISAG